MTGATVYLNDGREIYLSTAVRLKNRKNDKADDALVWWDYKDAEGDIVASIPADRSFGTVWHV